MSYMSYMSYTSYMVTKCNSGPAHVTYVTI